MYGNACGAGYSVCQPVGVLGEAADVCVPVLQRHGPVFIVLFKTVVVAVNSEVFTARESVQTYQRVHVISAGSGAVLDFLGHQVDVGNPMSGGR